MTKSKLIGSLQVPGDKSISHRALIFASFSKGISHIEGLSPAQDCLSTANCLRQLGLEITETNGKENKSITSFSVNSPGIKHLNAPKNTLFVGNSGTTIRLMSGLMAGQSFTSHFDGDDSIRKRPMARVLEHLEKMGAQVHYDKGKGQAPFAITGGHIKGSEFKLKVASAQVQTALLLAGLQATGRTTIHLPGIARDHTTRMFDHIGIPFKKNDSPNNQYTSVSIEALQEPIGPFQYKVPADISSAAFFMVAAACLPGSKLLLTNVGINSGRTLVINILKRMGADITLQNERIIASEPIADIQILGGDQLNGIELDSAEIASGIDEIPVLALAGSLCKGSFSVRGAEELRHKESDRLKLITNNLKAAGANIEELEDGFIIIGKKNIAGGSPWKTALDHRLAMSGLVANLLFDNPVEIEETGSTAISYPDFAKDLNSLLS